ncbi:MAG: hypothetical protein COB15_05160 [Flavobacteriales bacterium]|nr:MAG: hypothetical protein COB15_05160 [Flavobacteriales bacterium]
MNIQLKTYLLIISIFIGSFTIAQPNIGLLYSDINVEDGYTLFTPEKNTSTYLINNCGEIINEWTFAEIPGLTCYLLDNGNLLRSGRDSLQIRDWNNNIIWTYAMNSNGLKQHHDIEPLPNGNVLCLITDLYTNTEMIAEGRDPNSLSATFKLDKIVELQPVGTNSANIVWEWKFIDHFIQDFDNTKANFGIVQNSPELIDLNFNNGFNNDYTHCNSIDYNASLDQIIMSARHLDEIYIIDHSTTTIEAAGHTGGNSNMGGDILWRWGNPQVYREGTATDQKLFKQHDAKWVQSGYLDDGKISVFNNGGNGISLFSSIHLIEPEFTGGIYTKDTGKFKPLNFDWSWNGVILGSTVYESKKSGVQSLVNGNLLICETGIGRFSEITKNGNHVWSYKNPTGTAIYNQFDIVTTDNGIFRAEKYPLNFIGFIGQNLTPQGIIENVNSLSDACILSVDIEENSTENISIINPIRNGILQFNNNTNYNNIKIIDLNGKLVFNHNDFEGNNIQLNLSRGMYFLQLLNDSKREILKIVVD